MGGKTFNIDDAGYRHISSAEKPPRTKDKIVFAMIEAGGGHRSPALAVNEALQTLYGKKFDVLLVDFMKQLGCVDLDNKHKETWKYFLAHPFICKSSQVIADLAGPLYRAGLKQIYLYPFYSYVLQFLLQHKPSVIFSTHYFNTFAVDFVRRKFGLKVTLINYLTELFDVSSPWVIKGVDYYIVSSEEARKKLVLRGIPAEKLKVFGYPVRPSFFSIPRSREEIARGLGVDPSKKTLFMSFGREGVGNIDRFIDALERKDMPLNLVVNTGQNESLLGHLREKYGLSHTRSKLTFSFLGFTDRMNELIYLSDFVFIKPGPSTTMETIWLKKPILFYKSAQMSESPNIRYVTDNGLGYYIGDNVGKFARTVENLVRGKAGAETARRYDRLKIENGAFDIARFVAQTAEHSRSVGMEFGFQQGKDPRADGRGARPNYFLL
jgi:UDP-N-acetylglucosamine:LPS N-acetylglucosamine transferase